MLRPWCGLTLIRVGGLRWASTPGAFIIEDIALFDVALNRCLMNCRMSGFSLQDTLIACVFVLAEQKHIISEQLAECQSGTGQAIVIVDKDGETLERFKMMAKRDEKKE